MVELFKAAGYSPTIESLPDGGVRLTFADGGGRSQFIFYRGSAACAAAAKARKTADYDAEQAEKRKLDPYR